MLHLFADRLQSFSHNWGQLLRPDRTIDEQALHEVCQALKKVLVEADVNYKVATAFLARFKERALGQKIYDELDAETFLTGLLNEELTMLLGSKETPLQLEATSKGQPALILLFGLQGSGKTTTAAKLGLFLKQTQKAKNPLLVAADVYRPAAREQLAQLAEKTGLSCFTLPESTDMVAIAKAALAHAQTHGHDVVIVDTAGRQQVDTEQMADLLLLERSLKPQEKLLVLDAMMGQQAVAVTDAFHLQLGMSGLVLTKLDGDARGGAVLSVVEACGCPVKLIGTGEGVEDIEAFYPERMAGRLLGRGDMLSLFEKAQRAMDEKETGGLQKKLFSGKGMGFTDYLKLQTLLGRLGSLDQIFGMLPIPGLSKDLTQTWSHQQQQSTRRFKVLVNSMTPFERQHPDELNPERLARVAKGSGLPAEEAKEILKPFYHMRFAFSQVGQMMSLFGMGGGNDDDDEQEEGSSNAHKGLNPLTGKPKASKADKANKRMAAALRQQQQQRR